MKIKQIIASAFAVAALGLGIGLNPVTAYAEESAEIPVISSEIETSEEVIEETESVENSSNTEADKEITLEDLLDFVGELAEEEGLGDKWEEAVENMKNAASEKKVDIMVICSACNIGLLALYILVKLCKGKISKKNDTTKSDLADIKTASNLQNKAVNDLIDEEEKIAEELKANTKKEDCIVKAVRRQNVALRCLIRGTQIKQDLKDEALRALNKSEDDLDGAK